jgi:hypothetical protein
MCAQQQRSNSSSTVPGKSVVCTAGYLNEQLVTVDAPSLDLLLLCSDALPTGLAFAQFHTVTGLFL